MSLTDIDNHYRQMESLSHALAMLSVDEAVNMPEGGGEKRATAMAALTAMHHEMASSPKLGELLQQADKHIDSAEQRAALAEGRRSYLNRTCLPAEFVSRQTETNIKCEQAWRKLRPVGDWKAFEPLLADVLALAKDEAAMRADVLKLAPYDALIEQYDPGSRVTSITPVFDELKTFLAGFIPQALEVQRQKREKTPAKPFTETYPVEKQKALGEALMKSIGFDFQHGRLDVSHHPFCGGVPSDVRMTTRYKEGEFLSALMGILHETGHGLYEQGLPKNWSHWPVGHARGMAMHESQSLFVEMQLTRNPAFWDFALPLVHKHLGLSGWTVQDIMAHVHRIEKGLIRVEADEATYPLHVILRYELEQDLINGKARVRDIPEIWDAKMQAYLGLPTKSNVKDGPMQDVHWSAGAFGYFPSYTLGALMAAQQWATIEKRHPSVNEDIRNGSFETVNDWRARNIWQKASFLSTPDLMIAATGKALNPSYFMDHLQRRYLSI